MSSGRCRRRAARRLWLANVALATLIGLAYLSHVPPRASGATLLFAPIALASTMALLSLVPGLVLQAVAGLPWARTGAALQALAWSFFQLVLFADTRIYGIFRFHFNGMVWNLLTTPGAEDSVAIGARTWTLVGAAVSALALAQFLAARAWDRAGASRAEPVRRSRFPRPVPAMALALGLCVVTDKAVFAWSDLAGHRGIQSMSSLFPGYVRLTIRRFARTRLGQSIAHGGLDSTEGGVLDYPLEPIALPADGPRPNVLLIVIDSLRSDMLAAATMPRVFEVSRAARRFDDHLAAGNQTRHGVFGMLYGLPGSYWTPMLNERRSPVLLDALEAAGYDLRAFASASLASPELRSTCFAGLCREGSTARPGPVLAMDTDMPGRRPDWRIEDSLLHDSPGGRDTLTGERVAAWLREQGARRGQPFFAFVFLDAPHQVYSYPPEHEVFTPAATEIDYVSLAGRLDDATTRRLFNRYRNAVHYADAVTGAILDALEAARLSDATLVIVTGDHGEEFGENGFWGHMSNFCEEQVRVPLVMRGPGVAPGVESRPTSQMDLPATILEACGLPAASRSSWTVGESLLSPLPARRRIVAGWDRFALWTPGGIIWIPFAGRLGGSEVRDHDWIRLDEDDEDRVIEENADAIGALARDCGRFFR